MDHQRDSAPQRGRDERTRLRGEIIPPERRSAADLQPEDVTGDARRPRATPAPAVARPPASRPLPERQALRRTLSARHSLRQAILLSEILGPPKALRKPDDMERDA